jgi:hypothetical protein
MLLNDSIAKTYFSRSVNFISCNSLLNRGFGTIGCGDLINFCVS